MPDQNRRVYTHAFHVPLHARPINFPLMFVLCCRAARASSAKLGTTRLESLVTVLSRQLASRIQTREDTRKRRSTSHPRRNIGQSSLSTNRTK